MRIPIPFVGSHGEARSTFQNSQLTQNLYPEIDKEGKSPAVLYRVPGLVKRFEMSVNPCRSNGVIFGDKGYFVSGGGLYSVDSNENVALVGALSTTSGRVSIVAGFTYILLVDGVSGYTYDGTTFATITDVDFPANQTPALGVSHCTYKDGFFIVVADDTGDFYKSALENPTSWDATEFENAEGRPDKLKTCHAADDFLYLFGEYSTESWYNAGGSTFPFRRAEGGVSSWGIEAPYSVAEGDNAIYFLGRTREGGIEVCRTAGAQVQIVSTVEISDEINNLSTTNDAFAFIYAQNSHMFYVLTFDTAQRTFVFDISTNFWHIRKTKGYDRWRANGHLFFNKKHYVGDFQNGNFYQVDLNTLTDNGDYIKWIRRSPVIDAHYVSLIFDEIVLDCEGGVGTLTTDAEVAMRYSDDGGNTWSDDIIASIGKLGEYKTKAQWFQLGSSYERIFEFWGTDDTFTALLGAYAKVRKSAF